MRDISKTVQCFTQGKIPWKKINSVTFCKENYNFLSNSATMFVFSSSYTEGDKQAVWFTLGIREVIIGWDKGLQDMCSGEKRRLTVPPSLAYGKEGRGRLRIVFSKLALVYFKTMLVNCIHNTLDSLFKLSCF